MDCNCILPKLQIRIFLNPLMHQGVEKKCVCEVSAKLLSWLRRRFDNGKIQDGRPRPYLSKDRNKIRAGTTRSDKLKKSGLGGDAITILLQC